MPELPWRPHQTALARWAAARWGWTEGQPAWPQALALLAAAQDEGHTAFPWSQAADLWTRLPWKDGQVPPFGLPGPDAWPAGLFAEGWLRRVSVGGQDRLQSARQADLEERLLAALRPRAGTPQAPGGSGDDLVARAGQPLILLAGGPGTGKTTALRKLLEAWQDRQPGLQAVLAAPTGRAAARAREALATLPEAARPACLTLHRLLGLPTGLGAPWAGRERPLPYDLVIVDEASMLDLRAAVALVEALRPEAALVLVGDPGQLPSIEPGAVLAGLLAQPEFRGCAVHLRQRFRLSGASDGLGRAFDLLEADTSSDPEATAAALRELAASGAAGFRWEPLPEGADPGPAALAALGGDRLVEPAQLNGRVLLAPVHRGPGGLEALSRRLEEELGRRPDERSAGLPWMITRNLSHLDLSNGDRGLVVDSPDGLVWSPADGGRSWPFALVAADGEASWAVSVHKSQGSEYERVVLVLPPGDSPGLTRQLVYTGLTRARTESVLVASAGSLTRALARYSHRYSGWT